MKNTLMRLSSFTKPSNSFAGNVLKLMTGTAFAQALGILISPIVTRLFAPEAFGVAALFVSITGIFGGISCLRYNLAIMLPKTNEESANILAVSLCSAGFITIFSTTILLFSGDQILQLIQAPELKKFLWLIPITVFFSGVSLSLNYWNSRTKHFGRLSLIQIVSSVITQTTKLAAGFAGYVSGAILIFASMLGPIITAGALAGAIWREDKKLFLNCVRWSKIAEGFIRFKKFPIIDIWGTLLNNISWQLPALMLSSFFSMSVVGFYSLGLMVMMKPLSVVSNALAQVFYQKACEEKDIHNSNSELIENLMDKLMFVGILPIIVVAMIGEELFFVVFGARWSEAGHFSQILAPWIFFWFISSPLSTLFLVYERQGAALSAHSFIFITRVISLYIGGIYGSIDLALGLFSASGVIVYASVAAWNIQLAKASLRKIIFKFFKHCLHSLPILICLFWAKYIFQFSPIMILVIAFLILAVYLLIYRKIYISFVSNFIKSKNEL